jgi:hypothetical protein
MYSFLDNKKDLNFIFILFSKYSKEIMLKNNEIIKHIKLEINSFKTKLK